MRAGQVDVLCERMGLTIGELALVCGVEVRTVHRWRKGITDATGAGAQAFAVLWNVSGWRPEAVRRFVLGSSLMVWVEKALREALPPEAEDCGEVAW